jgi:hypothetical protein
MRTPTQVRAARRNVRDVEHATARYAARRRAQLDVLLEDPDSWRYLAKQAAGVRAQVPFGSEEWSVLTRLASVAGDLARLLDGQEQPAIPDETAHAAAS